MMGTLGLLALAAALEVGGDAAVRRGLVRSAWPWLVFGVGMLGAYGLVVNTNRDIDFGRLMGVYIVVFFGVSQAISVFFFGEPLSRSILIGGSLIVSGGVVLALANTGQVAR
jgi:small multidrug resistance family-3 protein